MPGGSTVWIPTHIQAVFSKLVQIFFNLHHFGSSQSDLPNLHLMQVKYGSTVRINETFRSLPSPFSIFLLKVWFSPIRRVSETSRTIKWSPPFEISKPLEMDAIKTYSKRSFNYCKIDRSSFIYQWYAQSFLGTN